MRAIWAMLGCVLLMQACGGGSGGSPSTVGGVPDAPIPWHDTNGGSFSVAGLPAPAAADARHMPIYQDGRRLLVGVDQGAGSVGAVPVVGQRDGAEIRFGRLVDGIGDAALSAFLRDTSAGRTLQPDLSPPVTVSWDSSASREDQRRIIRAVQLVNVALPEDRKMAVAGRGSIAIDFLDPAEYVDLYGDSWGISLYRGGIVINREYSDGGDRQAIILLAHELMHKLEFEHPPHSDYDTIIESGVNSQGYGTIYDAEQGIPQPLSLLYPMDREALQRLYSPFAAGPWESSSWHFAGRSPHAAFGVALRNGYIEPWAYGLMPSTDLAANSRLQGSASWTGLLVGMTPAAEAVAGNASIDVTLATMRGRAAFTDLESWAPGSRPGDAGTGTGTGTEWLDGDLRYSIAVRGNTFRQTSGDAGRVTGVFVGRDHEGATGTLERTDLTAAFGASR